MKPKFRPGDPLTVTLGRRGGEVSGKLSRERALDRVRAVWPEMPHAAAVVIHRYVESRVASALSTRSRRERKARVVTPGGN